MDAGLSQQRRFGQGGVLRVIVVGHGPSIFTGRGSVIDTFDAVVRLKQGLTTPAVHWGSRTDYLCARSPRFDSGHSCQHEFWLSAIARYPDSDKKPTTGLCAVMEAMTRLKTHDVTVIGFDRLMHPQRHDPPHTWLAHDKWAEHRYLISLGVRELG